MALANVDRGTGTSNTATNNFTLSPSGNFAARSMAVLFVAADNGGASGAHNITGVTDSLGNTWTLRQSPLNDPGAASAGVQGVIATCNQNVGLLATGTVITVSFGNTASVVRVWTLHEITCAAGTFIGYVTGATATATTGPTITTSSIPTGDAVAAGCFMEQGTVQTLTGDADTTNGNWSTQQYNEVGTTAAGISLGSQVKVVTGAGAQTYNPAMTTTPTDLAVAWVQLHEFNAYTLTASQLTLSLSGSAANLLRGRLIVGTGLTLSLSGSVASLLRGRLLTGAGATYALSGGTNAGTKGAALVHRTLTAAGLTLTLTLTAATVLHGRLLTAAGLALSATGGAAPLLHARLLTATGLTLSLSGDAANLLHGRSLAGSGLTLTLSGGAAPLLHGRLLTAGGLTLALVVGDASLLRGRRLTAAGGVFGPAAADALLEHDRLLGAGAASFTLSGAAASLLLGRKLTADGGVIAFTGGSAILSYVPAGAYALTGQGVTLTFVGGVASLLHGRQLTGDGTALAVTGADAALLHGRRLTATGLALTLTGEDADLAYAPAPGQHTLVAEGCTLVIVGGDALFALIQDFAPASVVPYPQGFLTLRDCDIEISRIEATYRDRLTLKEPDLIRALGYMRQAVQLRRRQLRAAGVTQ